MRVVASRAQGAVGVDGPSTSGRRREEEAEAEMASAPASPPTDRLLLTHDRRPTTDDRRPTTPEHKTTSEEAKEMRAAMPQRCGPREACSRQAIGWVQVPWSFQKISRTVARRESMPCRLLAPPTPRRSRFMDRACRDADGAAVNVPACCCGTSEASALAPVSAPTERRCSRMGAWIQWYDPGAFGKARERRRRSIHTVGSRSSELFLPGGRRSNRPRD